MSVKSVPITRAPKTRTPRAYSGARTRVPFNQNQTTPVTNRFFPGIRLNPTSNIFLGMSRLVTPDLAIPNTQFTGLALPLSWSIAQLKDQNLPNNAQTMDLDLGDLISFEFINLDLLLENIAPIDSTPIITEETEELTGLDSLIELDPITDNNAPEISLEQLNPMPKQLELGVNVVLPFNYAERQVKLEQRFRPQSGPHFNPSMPVYIAPAEMVKLETFGLKVEQMVKTRNIEQFSATLVEMAEISDPEELVLKCAIIENELVENSAEALPVFIEAVNLSCQQAEQNSSSETETVVQEVISVVENIIVNVTMKIIKVKANQEITKAAQLIIKYISKLDKEFITSMVFALAESAPAHQKEKAKRLQQLINKIIAKLLAHPAINKLLKLRLINAANLINKAVARALYSEILRQQEIGEIELSEEAIKLAEQIIKILLQNVSESPKIDSTDIILLMEQIRQKKLEQAGETIAKILKEQERKVNHSTLSAVLFAIYAGMLMQNEASSASEENMESAYSTETVNKVTQGSIYTDLGRDYKEMDILEAGAEMLIQGIILSYLEDHKKSQAVVQVLKEDESTWNKLTDWIISGNNNRIVDFIEDLISTAREIAKIKPIQGTSPGIVGLNNPISSKTLVSALEQIKNSLF